MKKIQLSLFILFIIQITFSQNKLSWQGYFSYNEIKDVAVSPTAIFAASENALFYKDSNTNEIKTVTTVDGLSGQTITSVHYSSELKKTLLGYANGLMIVINEADGSIRQIVDIINKQLPSGIKRVNHFMEYNGIVYVSCDFGIVQFNLSTMLFGDTYFIGDNGVEIKVNQTAVYDGYIYAATINGIRKANITSANLNNFNQWVKINSGNWTSIETFGTELIAINSSGYTHKYNAGSNSFAGYLQLPQAANDMRATTDYLIITTSGSVYVYNKQLVLVRQIDNSQIPESNVNFVCSINIGDLIYIGTKENGMYSTTIATVSGFENLTPTGPSRNNIFAIDVTSNSLWAVYGGYTSSYNPYPLRSYGVSKYNSNGWLNIPYDKVLNAKSISRITVNPNNENEVYASSFFSGLLKIIDDIPITLFNEKNSGLQTLTFAGPSYIDVRINGAAFDKKGNLWVTNSLVDKGIKVLKPNGEWQSFSPKVVMDDVQSSVFGRMLIDKNETKWFATKNYGIIGFDEITNTFKKISRGDNSGNLPVNDVRGIALDNNGQLWIGTTAGLRVLSNVNSFKTDSQLTTKSIIILEDDLAQELFYEQFITDIAVDGANYKWIGTADSGLFYVSPNGQETKYHFTTKNSPLPSNTINDIGINSSTGEVFIATDKGMVSFKGIATKANDNLENSYVYPNPVRPEYQGTVKIAGLIDKANIKITDIEGNLVYETISEGGTIEWDTTAFGKYKVASGVYMIFISAQDGMEAKVKKVMIIR